MTLQRLLRWGTLTAGAACLAAGYGLAGRWGFLAVSGLAWLAGILLAGWSVVVFVVLVGLAAVGIYEGAGPILMILGATLALASWDLANWEDFVAGGLPAETSARFEWGHHTCLALALGSGLLVIIIGRLVSFQLPFGILVLLAALALLGIDRMWRLVKGWS
jgi:hypothetical protein